MKRVFCIGPQKTGTTSLAKLFQNEGYVVAPQYPFEKMAVEYLTKNYYKIYDLIDNDFKHCNFFQDVPFSFYGCYKILYEKYPNAKYILSIRNSSEDWYDSLNRFIKLFNKNFSKINKSPIINAEMFLYYKIYMHYIVKNYDKETLIKGYNNHIKDANEFFKNKDNFIQINLSKHEDFIRLENFLGIKFKSKKFPHENRTK